MGYELKTFCDDARAALTSGKPIDEAIDIVAARMADLLKNPDFVASTFKGDPPPGKTELFHDSDLDFYVLAHVQEGGKRGTPHSHGTSWAIYGNATARTEMTLYRRVNPESEEAAVLEVIDRHTLGPGDTHAYGPGQIHSTAHPEKAWVLRVTGTDLDVLPRYKFRKFRDTVLEQA